MIKTITFGDKEVKFSTAFMWVFKYKSQFGHDPAKLFLPAVKEITNANEKTEEELAFEVMEKFGFIGIIDLAWSMAALCDSNISEPEAWVGSFGEDFDIFELITELMPEAIESLFSTKNQQAPIPAPEEGQKKKTRQ